MAKPKEELVQILERLPQSQQSALLDFARYLDERYGRSASAFDAPEPIPRRENESVIAAMKRLSASYHMVDKSKMLHETSALMAQHVMQGREAGEVIEELEMLFERHYHAQNPANRDDGEA